MPNMPQQFRLNEASTFEGRRKNSHQRGYTRLHSKNRKAYLRENPLCAVCAKEGYSVPATVLDHILPFRGNIDLRDNPENWQGLCKTCHDIKTGRGL